MVTQGSVTGWRQALACALLLSAFAVACASQSDAAGASGDAIAASSGQQAVYRLRFGRGDDDRAELRELLARGIDVAGVSEDEGVADLVLWPDEAAALAAEGFDLTLIGGNANADAFANNDEAAEDPYASPDDVARITAELAARYPALASRVSLGRSHERRDVWALRITGAGAGPKPAIAFNGAHHSREVMSVEVVLDIAEQLLSNYGTDPRITRWVDANETWLVPMVNVDGAHRVAGGQTMWRKNARGCPASGTCPSSTGVDLNRNYPFKWGACGGSSPSPSSDQYRGPSAASEPETQAFMGLIERARPVFSVAFHSYAEYVVYPYGCEGTHVAERALVAGIGAQIASRIPKDRGAGTYRSGTIWELLYSVDGGGNDWMYATFGVYPFTVELNGSDAGFHPPFNPWRDRTVTKLRPAWQYLYDRIDGSGVRGIVVDRTTGQPLPDAAVSVTRVNADGSPIAADGSVAVQRTTGEQGSFHILLAPGSYTVRARSAAATSAVTITIGDERRDVTLPL